MERNTKIVVTLGPAVASAEAIADLVAAGMDVARLNFSHGDHDTHRRFVRWVRQAAEQQKRPVAVLQDIQGPKIRVGTFEEGQVVLHAGQRVDLYPGKEGGTSSRIPVDYPHLIGDVGEGSEVALADGLVRLRVVEEHVDKLVAEVIQGGTVTDRRGVAFPHAKLRVSAVTDKDRADLSFGRQLGVDYVAASFVQSAADVQEVKGLAGVPVIAKIERAEAYRNLAEILEVAEGAMVARGDLGVELPLEQIPFAQRDILRQTNATGLISVTATEMLESMIHATRPTRAEVTDVAVAVSEGTDAVMLSGETAVGEYPVETVQMMARILAEAEEHPIGKTGHAFLAGESAFSSATARAAVEAAFNLGIEKIVAFTESGMTARLLSKYRPRASIMAFSPVEATRRRMAIYWGVVPFAFERRPHTDDMIDLADRYLVERGICTPDEGVVMVAGTPPNRRASTNLMKLHVIKGGAHAKSGDDGRSG